MKKSIILNSKEYEIPEFTYGTLCELENLGLNFTDISTIQNKPLNFVRVMLAYVCNSTLKQVDEELTKFLSEGGDFAELFNPIIDALNSSDFFQIQSKKHKK